MLIQFPNANVLTRVTVLVLLAAATLVLTGCPSGGYPRDGDAARAEQQGRYEEAARSYERLAAGAPAGTERDAYFVDASRAWLEAGQTARALSTLERVRTPLPENDSAVGLLRAYRALRDGSSIEAISLLDDIHNELPERYNALWYELRGRAYLSSGDASAGVETLVEREFWLNTESAIQNNREILWRGLSELAAAGSPLTPGVATSDITVGWLALAESVQRGRTDPYAAGREIRTWQEDNPEHPAHYLALRLLGSLPETLEYPSAIAVLLPLSGNLSASGAAIRDGMMAAWLGDADNPARPALRFYDTAGLTPTQALQSAIADGAEFVVGPLRKSAVEEIAEQPEPISLLALNYLAEGPGPRGNFFQFALAPEHEAAAAANRALDEGLLTAVALVPENNLGARMSAAFRQALEARGGVLLDERVYATSSSDFAVPITELMNLNESTERYRQVSAVTGLRLEFEPRRRRDVDFVFVAANPRQGRQIRPAFAYHYAEDLPIFATASIFEDDPQRNGRDLDGVVFADMPWIVDPAPEMSAAQIAFSRYWPNRINRRGRFYALGFDAYRVIPQLMSTDEPLLAPWPGASGMLTMGPGGRIVRDLRVAEVRGGRAIPLPPLQEAEPELPGIEPLFGIDEEDDPE